MGEPIDTVDKGEVYNIFQGAIESIEACADSYNVKIAISRNGKGASTSKYSNKWRVIAMGKTFYHEDFIEALKPALLFVHNAHNPDNILTDPKESK